MSWDNFYNTVKQTAILAADKINQTADLATLQVKLSMAEHKLNDAYAALGKVAYAHFTSDESRADAVANAIKPVEIALANVKVLKEAIEDKKAENAARSEEKAQLKADESNASEEA